MTAVLGRSGIVINLSDIVPHKNGIRTTINKMKTFYTVTTMLTRDIKVSNSQFKKYKLKNKEVLVLPRFLTYRVINRDPAMVDSKGRHVCDILGMNKITNVVNNIGRFNKTKLGRCEFRPKPHQTVIIDYIIDNVFCRDNMVNGQAGMILKLETGLGKSFIGMGLNNILARRTLYVCPNTNILFDWLDKLKQVFPQATIGQQYTKTKTMGNIVVGIVDSLIKDEIKLEYKSLKKELDVHDSCNKVKHEQLRKILANALDEKGRHKKFISIKYSLYFALFDFVIFDECDCYVSKSYSKIFSRSQSAYMLGLSATPEDRLDKFHKVAIWHIGSVIDANTIPGFSMGNIVFTGDVDGIRYNGCEPYITPVIRSNGEMDIFGLMTNVLQDPYRMDLVLHEIKKLYDTGSNVFVYAGRRKYLQEMQMLCYLFGIYADIMDDSPGPEKKSARKNDSIAHLLGGTSRCVMKETEKKAQIILTTYQYYGVGKSLPKMTAVIYASPRKNKGKQFIGRILRLGSDHTIKRKVVDIIDDSCILGRQYNSRKKVYNEKNFPITEVDTSYRDYSDFPETALYISEICPLNIAKIIINYTHKI